LPACSCRSSWSAGSRCSRASRAIRTFALGFGTGGIGIERTRDFALRFSPLREGDAETMISETGANAMLQAYRGGPAADRVALATTLYALADFALVEARSLAEIDLNPIKVLPDGEGCRILDALIVTRDESREEHP
jgi:hypothetical protein